MSKNLKMSVLLDFYGDILTDNQREAMDMFYNGDYSLAEISEEVGITRQGVRERLLKSEKTLSGLEEKLGLADKFTDMQKDVSELISMLEELQRETGRDMTALIEIAERIRDR